MEAERGGHIRVRSGHRVRNDACRGSNGRWSGGTEVGGAGGRSVEVTQGGVRRGEQAEAVGVAGHETDAAAVGADEVRPNIGREVRRGGDDVDAARASGGATEEARAGVQGERAAVCTAGGDQGAESNVRSRRACGEIPPARAFQHG